MKRRLLIIAVCLLAGAIVNVAVAGENSDVAEDSEEGNCEGV